MALTAKMIKFVNEYLIDLNATQAAIRAGYSQDTAGSIGSENLQKPEIQEFMDRRKKEIADVAELSPEWVIQNLKEVALRCKQAEPVMIKIDGELVPSGEYKFDSNGANRALELIGKQIGGMFVNKVDLTTKGESIRETPSAKIPSGEEIDI